MAYFNKAPETGRLLIRKTEAPDLLHGSGPALF